MSLVILLNFFHFFSLCDLAYKLIWKLLIYFTDKEVVDENLNSSLSSDFIVSCSILKKGSGYLRIPIKKQNCNIWFLSGFHYFNLFNVILLKALIRYCSGSWINTINKTDFYEVDIRVNQSTKLYKELNVNSFTFYLFSLWCLHKNNFHCKNYNHTFPIYGLKWKSSCLNRRSTLICPWRRVPRIEIWVFNLVLIQ